MRIPVLIYPARRLDDDEDDALRLEIFYIIFIDR